MANKDRTGFYPVGTLTGASWTAGVRRFVANTTTCNIAIGAVVQLDAAGKADPTVGAGTNILGAVVGIEPVAKTTTSVAASSLSLERSYIPKGTAGTVYVRVSCDPFAIYETITSNGTAITTANIGENYGILGATGDAVDNLTVPLSSATMDIGNPLVSVAGQMVLLDIPTYPDNDLTAANTRVHVVFNQTVLKAGKATAG